MSDTDYRRAILAQMHYDELSAAQIDALYTSLVGENVPDLTNTRIRFLDFLEELEALCAKYRVHLKPFLGHIGVMSDETVSVETHHYSTHHCEIEYKGGTYQVFDVASRVFVPKEDAYYG